jgi:lipopolysaccharide export system protein LptC
MDSKADAEFRKDAVKNAQNEREARRAARLRTASDFTAAPAQGVVASLRHRSLVHALKIALPLLALALVVTMIVYSLLFHPDGTIAIFSGNGTEQGQIVMKSPRFIGSDKDNQPFEVIASQARQHTDDRAVVELDDVNAKLQLNKGPQLRLIAHKGVLDTNNQLLQLTGPIALSSSEGYLIHTDEARADLKNGLLTGQRPIEATGSFGTIRADGFSANKTEQTISFLGNVKVHFEPQTVTK